MSQHDDLLDLLSESLAMKKASKETAPVDDLDALMAESLSYKEKELAAKRAYAAARKGFSGFSAEEAAACNAIVQAWDTEQNWIPVQDLAVYHRFTCNCGECHHVFHRFMQRQDHKRNGSARWVTVVESDGDLPRAAAVQDFKTLICTECADTYDFAPEKALPLEDFFNTRELIGVQGVEEEGEWIEDEGKWIEDEEGEGEEA